MICHTFFDKQSDSKKRLSLTKGNSSYQFSFLSLLLLQLWGEYYREVLADPEGSSHQNIRNFMKTGWEGVPFENGIALTRKAAGDADWDAFAESWIP